MVGFASLSVAGCGSSPANKYYTLTPITPATTVAPAQGGPVTVTRLTIPATFDRPQIVRRTGATTVDIAEFERWAEPLEDMAKRVLAADLAQRTGPGPARSVTVDLDTLDIDPGGAVSLTARWSVSGGAVPQPPRSASLSDPGQGAASDAVAASLSRVLAALADRIAAL